MEDISPLLVNLSGDKKGDATSVAIIEEFFESKVWRGLATN